MKRRFLTSSAELAGERAHQAAGTRVTGSTRRGAPPPHSPAMSNRAVARLLGKEGLSASQPGDPLERAADRQARPLADALAGSADAAAPTATGAGERLHPAAEAALGELGHDARQVRIRADGGASETATALGALAYTVGNEIGFGAGLYPPRTTRGRRLLAHELVHVEQRRAGLAPPGLLQRQDAGSAVAAPGTHGCCAGCAGASRGAASTRLCDDRALPPPPRRGPAAPPR